MVVIGATTTPPPRPRRWATRLASGEAMEEGGEALPGPGLAAHTATTWRRWRRVWAGPGLGRLRHDAAGGGMNGRSPLRGGSPSPCTCARGHAVGLRALTGPAGHPGEDRLALLLHGDADEKGRAAGQAAGQAEEEERRTPHAELCETFGVAAGAGNYGLDHAAPPWAPRGHARRYDDRRLDPACLPGRTRR